MRVRNKITTNNMNTHETYVSPEVANLLKQAGFDWHVKSCWDLSVDGDVWLNCDAIYPNNFRNNNEDIIYAPTLEVVQRWLREVKGIYVESVLCVNRGTSGHSFGFSIAEISADLSTVKTLYPSTYFDEEETKGFVKYELSLEAGIKKALEIILGKGEIRI